MIEYVPVRISNVGAVKYSCHSEDRFHVVYFRMLSFFSCGFFPATVFFLSFLPSCWGTFLLFSSSLQYLFAVYIYNKGVKEDAISAGLKKNVIQHS